MMIKGKTKIDIVCLNLIIAIGVYSHPQKHRLELRVSKHHIFEQKITIVNDIVLYAMNSCWDERDLKWSPYSHALHLTCWLTD